MPKDSRAENMTAAKLIFMGTPDYAVPSLDALLAADYSIAAVYCQPPRPAGRGKKPRASPVQRRAEAAGLKVRMPVSLMDAQQQQEFAALGADLCIVIAYGLILPQAVLDAPRLGCINAHASLLPRWRGAAPIQRAIMAGDGETGVSIMQMDAGLLARATVWAATSPNAANEPFNVTNGDAFRYADLWPQWARLFGMEVGNLQRIRTGEMMADKGPIWQRMVKKHGLHPYPFEDLGGWEFFDWNLETTWDIIYDNNKRIQAGFTDVVDTEAMFLRLLGEYRQRKVIP